MPGQSPAQWRLLDTGPAEAYTNMAIDEALLTLFVASQQRPTLRFYTWSPPALSLGYGQPMSPYIDRAQCWALGIDMVRRPTGGRAVLHDDEVTYSVVISADDPRVTAGVLAAYLTISQALIRGLSYLGIAAELLPLQLGAPLPSDPVSPVCFATPSSYEVVVQGRKIIGSAQRRAHGVIMQHGSIPLSWDMNKMRAVFALQPRVGRLAQGERLDQMRMTSLQEVGGRPYDYAEVVAALRRGMAETWDVELIADTLTSEERRLSEHLCASKYRSEAWTLRF